jgi:hypothetical protein
MDLDYVRIIITPIAIGLAFKFIAIDLKIPQLLVIVSP